MDLTPIQKRMGLRRMAGTVAGPVGPTPPVDDKAVVAKLAGAEPKQAGLGDVVERLAKPVAKALGLGCLDAQGKLKPESGCAKRRDALNRMFPKT